MSKPFKIGVISDTHDYLDPRVLDLFAGVDHILHAGDIGLPWLLLQLEGIAPVTAVIGNCDSGIEYKETESLVLSNRKFMVHHIVDVQNPSETLSRALKRHQPEIVIFGHTHKPFSQQIGNILYFNPGYAGKPRLNMPRSVAILECSENGIRRIHLPL
jgi:hypothetical protein